MTLRSFLFSDYSGGSSELQQGIRGDAANGAAGIQAIKLEELERRLRTDIMQEAIAWAGRVMLHKEVSVDPPAARQPAPHQIATSSKHGITSVTTLMKESWQPCQNCVS